MESDTAPALTSGAARALFGAMNDAASIAEALKQGICVQLLDFKPLGEGTPKEKYRVTVSDGVEGARAMLAPKYNDLCKRGAMSHGSLVKITDASCVAVGDSRIIVVKELEVLAPGGEADAPVSSPTLITSLAESAPKAEEAVKVEAGAAAEAAEPEAPAEAAKEQAQSEQPDAAPEGAAEAKPADAADAPMPEAAPVPEQGTAPEAPAPKPEPEAAASVAQSAGAEATAAAPAAAPEAPDAEPMEVEAAGAAAAAPPSPSAVSPPKAPAGAAPMDATHGTLDATPVHKRPREAEPGAEQLAGGCVRALFEAAGNAPVVAGLLAERPTVQVIEIRRIDGVTEKYRLTLSDGTHYLNALCSPRLNAEVKGVQKDGTIRIVAGVCNLVSGRRVLILNQLEVLSAAPLPAGRLGSPVDVERAAHGLAEMKTPSPHGGGSGALASLAAERKLACGRVVPIASLTPYMASFAIKGRLTLLEEPRGYSRGDKAGRVMTIQICDAETEIRATLWSEAVDAFEPILKEGGIYLIASSKGSSVKIANKRYSTLKNDYELSLGADARIVRCAEDEAADGGRGSMLALLDVVPIANLAAKPAQAAVDVVGALLEVGPVQKITRKSGDELTKRTVLLADRSGASVELALWDAHAGKVDESMTPGGSGAGEGGVTVISVKGARVSEWNCKSLATGRGSQLALNPQRDEAEDVRAWWAERGAGGGAAGLSALSVNERANGPGGAGGAGGLPSERLELSELTLDSAAMLKASAAGKPLYASSRLWLQKVQVGENRPLWYAACPKCSRKLHGDEVAGWSCENCATSVAEADFRYILSAVGCDHSGKQWLSLFNETGVKLLGQRAGDLKALRDVNEEGFNAALNSHNWAGPFCARLRVKSETWNGEAKVRINALDLAPCDFAAEAAAMLADIKAVKL